MKARFSHDMTAEEQNAILTEIIAGTQTTCKVCGKLLLATTIENLQKRIMVLETEKLELFQQNEELQQRINYLEQGE